MRKNRVLRWFMPKIGLTKATKFRFYSGSNQPSFSTNFDDEFSANLRFASVSTFKWCGCGMEKRHRLGADWRAYKLDVPVADYNSGHLCFNF